MKTSIIIPTYNRKKILKRCLELLFTQNFPSRKYEIVVVDDGSNDGTDRMISSLSPPCSFVYIHHQKQKGGHIARNTGIARATGEIIINIDSDVLAPPDFIFEHMRCHQVYGDKIILSGPTVRTENLMEDFSDIEKKKKREYFYWSGACFITCNLSVKRKYLIRVGGFDENFQGFGWHDWDLGLQLTKLGLIPKRNVHAIAYHYKKRKEEENLCELIQKRVQRGRNAVLYYKKHPSFKVKLGIRAHQLLTDRLFWWLDGPWGEKIVRWAKKNNEKFILKTLAQWKLNRAYVKGLKQGMQTHKVRLWPWMQV